MLNNETQHKRVIVVHWKDNQENPFEIFSSLKNFCLSYRQYNYNTISNYLSKGKIAFDNENVRIERKNVYLKPKTDLTERKIIPVLRRVPLKEADDYGHDLQYWLAKPPSERLAAVTRLIGGTSKKSGKLDKSQLVKRPLKE